MNHKLISLAEQNAEPKMSVRKCYKAIGWYNNADYAEHEDRYTIESDIYERREDAELAAKEIDRIIQTYIDSLGDIYWFRCEFANVIDVDVVCETNVIRIYGESEYPIVINKKDVK